MGRNEFYAWVEQLNAETAQQETTSSWQNADRDPGWQAMRQKRKDYQGR